MITFKTTHMKNALLIAATGLLFFSACNENKGTTDATANKMDSASTKNTMEAKEESNKQAALQSVREISKGNVDEGLKNVSSDAIDYGDGNMPAMKGIDTIKAGLKQWLSAVKDYKVENEIAVADGDYVFVYGDWSGTFSTDFMNMKTAGKSFKVRDVDIFKFNDEGKITEHRGVQAFNTILSQVLTKGK